MKKLWKELIDFLKLISMGKKKAVPVMLLGGMTSSAVPFIGVYFSAQILNQLLAGEFSAAQRSIVMLLTARLVCSLIAQACQQTVNVLEESCEKIVKQQLAEKAFELEYEEFEKQETMDALRRVDNSALGSGGIDRQTEIAYCLIQSGFLVIYSLIFVVLLFLQVDPSGTKNFFTSYASGLVLLVVFTFVIFISNRMEQKRQDLFEQMRVKNDRMNAIGNYLGAFMGEEKNAKDIRIFQLSDALMEKEIQYCTNGSAFYLQTGKEFGKYSGMKNLVLALAEGISYLFVGAKAFYGVIGIGDILLYTNAINQALKGILEFSGHAMDFLCRANYLNLYAEYIRRPSMSYDGTLPIEKRNDAKYEFAFHNVSFAYPGTTEQVLHNVSLTFTVGEKMALVGKNGAGKTTVIKLLCRLYEPTEGVITLNGIDIRKYNYKEYTAAFSVVFQDFAMFSLPLGENVAAGQDVDEERLNRTLQEVSLKKRVDAMEQGWHSRLYNNNGAGIDISGGEAQRLAIARALYKDAPFVILDEPTAALDPIAEAEIYENFNGMIQNKTAVYISHRMSSCKFCDRIVVLDHGTVAEWGTHEQLLEQDGIYAELYEMQAQYYA